jgi:hypothetical protein
MLERKAGVLSDHPYHNRYHLLLYLIPILQRVLHLGLITPLIHPYQNLLVSGHPQHPGSQTKGAVFFAETSHRLRYLFEQMQQV